MSDYGADPDPDITKMMNISYAYNFIGPGVIMADQYTIDANTHVYKFCSRKLQINIKFKVDPNLPAGDGS